jgi:hypothetical protein
MHLRIKTLSLILFSIILTSCAWLGVETQHVGEESLNGVYTATVLPTSKFSEIIKPGISTSELTKMIGKGEIMKSKSGETYLSYPADYDVHSGITFCLAVIPIPLRLSSDGEYKFYIDNGKVTKITNLTTDGGFYGVYIDDSGYGTSSGQYSKCDI